jgi:hypothetical protein
MNPITIDYQPRWVQFCRVTGYPPHTPRIGWRFVNWISRMKGDWMEVNGIKRNMVEYHMGEQDQESFDKFLEALPDYGTQEVLAL